jgi:hypothetical protein
MHAADSKAVTDAEAELKLATEAVTTFKTGKEAHQAVLDEIAQSQIAVDHAESNAAYALHRCIHPDQQAHYDKKIAAEKEMWKYDEMSDTNKKIFDDHIAAWTAFHQENDAKVKEETGYYKMTDAEKSVFNKMYLQTKENTDYYDQKFDTKTRQMMGEAKF